VHSALIHCTLYFVVMLQRLYIPVTEPFVVQGSESHFFHCVVFYLGQPPQFQPPRMYVLGRINLHLSMQRPDQFFRWTRTPREPPILHCTLHSVDAATGDDVPVNAGFRVRLAALVLVGNLVGPLDGEWTRIPVGFAAGTGDMVGWDLIISVGGWVGALVGTPVSVLAVVDGLLAVVPFGMRVGAVTVLLVGVTLGLRIGVFEGLLVGVSVGIRIGAFTVLLVGITLGIRVGVFDGLLVGVTVGERLGASVGFCVGDFVGEFVGGGVLHDPTFPGVPMSFSLYRTTEGHQFLGSACWPAY
jgi:hypothetical protein